MFRQSFLSNPGEQNRKTAAAFGKEYIILENVQTRGGKQDESKTIQ